MIKFSVALLLASGAVATMTAFPQPAAAIEYPWCAQYSGDDGDGGKNCGFVSWEQCMETARGMGDCAPNLFYEGPAKPPAKRVRKRNSHDG